MVWSDFARARAACAYFFLGVGLIYGIFTSRMPALREATGADAGEIGFILLAVGASSFCALTASRKLVERFGSQAVLSVASVVISLALVLAALAESPLMLGVAAAMLGLPMGFLDVAMNTQGILVERRFGRPAMSSMHAAYSFGGVFGAVSGSLFAAAGAGVLANALVVVGLFLLGRSLALKNLISGSGKAVEVSGATDGRVPGESQPAGGAEKSSASRLPFYVILCGIVSTCAYAAEGAVGEWGSLLLNSEKGAPESLAALVYAVFCTVTGSLRLVGDAIRLRVNDTVLLVASGLTAAAGLSIVLVSDSAWPALAGYAVMAAGLSLVVPTLFSLAGAHPDVDPVRASSVVALVSYSGLLLAPPLLGFVANHSSIGEAQALVLILCAIITVGSLGLRPRGAAKKAVQN